MSREALQTSFAARRRPRMYRPGAPPATLDELVRHCREGGYVYLFGPLPKHGGFVLAQQAHTLDCALRGGKLKPAEFTPEYEAWMKEQAA